VLYHASRKEKFPLLLGLLKKVGMDRTMIFVNTTDPTTALTQAQIDKLAYADCTAGGMMMSSCMTGTTVAGYGRIGTMSGYPVSQVITKQ